MFLKKIHYNKRMAKNKSSKKQQQHNHCPLKSLYVIAIILLFAICAFQVSIQFSTNDDFTAPLFWTAIDYIAAIVAVALTALKATIAIKHKCCCCAVKAGVLGFVAIVFIAWIAIDYVSGDVENYVSVLKALNFVSLAITSSLLLLTVTPIIGKLLNCGNSK